MKKTQSYKRTKRRKKSKRLYIDGMKRKLETTEDLPYIKKSKLSLEDLFSNININDNIDNIDNISKIFDNMVIDQTNRKSQITKEIEIIKEYQEYLKKKIDEEYEYTDYEEGSEIIINMKKLIEDLDNKKKELEEELWE